MGIDLVWLALGTVGSACVLAVSQHFLLLGIDRERRVARRQKGARGVVDVRELDTTVGPGRAMVRAAARRPTRSLVRSMRKFALGRMSL